ncbi:Mycothiol acetyltransferase [Actinomadura rubteroloni]|uniref:Mycothiol acetyltransferase n=1 Tax=Actinomadura rubteroloni TaxID=1926885 RepID=A0A2P4UDG0_9ACTN|nr:GNAT family N-acetyltransferase [Actinomadura rubteroloni]POM23087.1 Mycothiol acetyltransferase [Actinomadura rubteroloni]
MTAPPPGLRLRALAPGDLGWVISRNGALYAAECGWDETYEARVAEVLSTYVVNRDPARADGWIAELDGERAGAVFCSPREGDVAQLRMLHVEPFARGAGVGAALIDACLTFARQAGYREIALWTTALQRAAIRLYERAGFRLTTEDPPVRRFGDVIHGQLWTRPL